MITFDDIMVVIAVGIFGYIILITLFPIKKDKEKWNRVHRSIWDVARKHEDD